jgi:hypothetical protein
MLNHGNNKNNNTPKQFLKRNLTIIYIFHTLRNKMEK